MNLSLAACVERAVRDVFEKAFVGKCMSYERARSLVLLEESIVENVVGEMNRHRDLGDGGVMVADTQMQEFAEALTDLCHRHGVMIWTAAATTPIMASTVSEDDAFHYVADRPEFGNSVIIRRVMDKSP